MAMHGLTVVVVAGWVFGFFVPVIPKTDKSMARHPGFVDYQSRNGLLLPAFEQ
jgi:hypothetical protein